MPEIKINERFSIERDGEGWTLTEYRHGKNNKGEPTVTPKNRYYPRLHHVIDEMLDVAPSTASTLEGLRREFIRVKGDILAALKR